MTMSFSEINELIESGQAVPALNGFLRFAVALSIGIRTGKMQELPGTKETIIAAVALQKLMDTTDGRKLLGIRASNKVYNEKEFGLKSAPFEIARRMGCGEITRQQALDNLSDFYHSADTYPTRQTLNRILDGLTEDAGNLRANLELMLITAGWDGTTENLEQVFKSITQDRK